MNMIIRSGALIVLASAAVTSCSTASTPTASPATSSRTTAPVTSTGFPVPPPYTVEVDGNQVKVSTSSADETDLRNTYNTVARTLRPTLAEGAYWVRINCANPGAGNPAPRLANGTIGVGKKGIAVHGDFGSFTSVVPGAHCP
ncbi:hypothetical protein [Nocardia asteroides]|uniref:hypothetical protein n=1 Tax=Nocardia asteroides TaxID=1824 RepID=UPI0033D46F86